MGSDGFVNPGLCLGNPAISRHGLRPSISILSEMLKAEGSVLLLYYSYWSSGRLFFIYLTIFGKYFRAFRKVVRIRMMQRKSIYPSLRFISLSPLHPCTYIDTCVCLYMYAHIFQSCLKVNWLCCMILYLIICQVHFINKCSVIISSDNTILDIGVIFFLIYG